MSVDTYIDTQEEHMDLLTNKFGFDTTSLAITVSMFGAQALMGALGLPAVITRMSPEKFGLLTVILGGPLGLTATHLANILLGKKTNAIKVNLASSLKLDAVRGAIFLGLEIMAAMVAILLQL